MEFSVRDIYANFAFFEPLIAQENCKVMKNVKFILESNKCDNKKAKKYVNLVGGKWVFEVKNTSFDSRVMKRLLYAINYILSFKKLPVEIVMKNSKFQDKLVIKILECICYYLIEYLDMNIIVRMNIQNNIMTTGIKYSSLNARSRDELRYYFFDDTTTYYFRRIISYDCFKTSDISNKSTEVLNFFKCSGIEKKTSQYLALAISEVLGNAIEHGKSDCLIDIDISDEEFTRKDNPDIKYFIINAVVLNFSNVPFYRKLKNKLNEPLKWNDETKERYEKVISAKDYHSMFFGNNYTEDDFYIISSFQHGISGDFSKEGNGGVGLTQLIRAVEEKSDGDYCYMLSEKRVISFLKEYMHYDDEMFIGFNETKDFFKALPDDKVLQKSDTYFPGVAYNLSFAIKKEDFKSAKSK